LFPGAAKEPSASGAGEVSAQETLGKGPSERLNSPPSLVTAAGTCQKNYVFAARVAC